MKKLMLSNEELQMIIDGLEDTKTKIFDRTAYPVDERYIFLNRSLRKRLEKLLKE